MARDLQAQQDKKAARAIDEANSHRVEAVIALARHVAMHNEVCAQYEREMEGHKDRTAQITGVLGKFINEHLSETLGKASPCEVDEIFDALAEADNNKNHSVKHVRADLYEDLRRALQKADVEKADLQALCSEQLATIQQQSQDLDQSVERVANVINRMQEKGQQIQELQDENAVLQQRAQVDQTVSEKGRQIDSAPQTVLRTMGAQKQPQESVLEDEEWMRDAEIINLRRKLDNAYKRERELKRQVDLSQSSQNEQSQTEKPPSRFKRFLGGQQKSSPSIPTLSSMQNLSSAVFTPFHKEKLQAPERPSPNEPGRFSPSSRALGNSADPLLDQLGLPLAHYTGHMRTGMQEESPPQRPARIRMKDGMQYPPLPDEIESAVSGRFHQAQPQTYHLPTHLRVSASTSRPNTPRGSSKSSFSFEDVPECPPKPTRPHGRSHSASAPDLPDIGVHDETAAPRHRNGSYDDRQLLDRRQRVLSGITEVTEDAASFHQRPSSGAAGNGGSPDSFDRKMYLESIDAARALGGLHSG